MVGSVAMSLVQNTRRWERNVDLNEQLQWLPAQKGIAQGFHNDYQNGYDSLRLMSSLSVVGAESGKVRLIPEWDSRGLPMLYALSECRRGKEAA